jgi:hypothetical protein
MMQIEARSHDSSCTAKTAKQFGKTKQSKPEADVAQLAEQPACNCCKIASLAANPVPGWR